MKGFLRAVLSLSVALGACTGSGGHAPGPCSLLRAAEVARATGSPVTSVRNIPSIKSNLIRLCSYETNGRFGAITVFVTDSPNPSSRSRFEHPDESTRLVHGLGDGAYLYGGISLTVRLGDTYFELGTQYYEPASADILEELARDALKRV